MKKTLLLNWLCDQQQSNVTKFGEDHHSNYGKHTNGKFNSMFGRKFSEHNNQSQQSNELQNYSKVKKGATEATSFETACIPIRRIKNELCFEKIDRLTGKKLVGSIDMRVGNNYILRKNIKLGKILKLRKQFFIETIHGQIKISEFVIINLFSYDLQFFIVDFLDNFDFVFGMNSLREIKASVDFLSFKLTYKTKIENKGNVCCESIENVKVGKENVQEEKFERIETGKGEIKEKKIEYKKIKETETVKNVQTKKIEKADIKKRKIREDKIESNMNFNSKNAVGGVEIYKQNFPTKIRMKNLRQRESSEKTVLNNLANDFKFFEPG